jgi:FkbM family methyltransferase
MKFVQIGAHTGNDDAFEIIKKHDIEFGLLVEPLPNLIPLLKESYKEIPNITIENQAIAINDNDVISFYCDVNDPTSELSSLNKEHLLRHDVKEEHIQEIKVPAISLESLLDKYNITELDYLFIDTEGFDFFILNSFNFHKYKIKNIIFEDAHTDGPFSRNKNYAKLTTKLTSEGYTIGKFNPSNSQAILNLQTTIIYRTSDSGYKKTKPEYITNENCLKNAVDAFPPHKFNWVVIADNVADENKPLIEKYIDPSNIHYVSMGDGAKTFNYALDYALNNLKDNEIVYFLENDYLHKPGSYQALLEGINLGSSFVSLYDHPDKYLDPFFGGNKYCEGGAEDTRVYLSYSTHWKMTNSTTMTFASKVSTLKKTEPILRKWTSGTHPDDFSMFIDLRNNNELLVTPIPGFSTHGETAWLSPLIDWNKI